MSFTTSPGGWVGGWWSDIYEIRANLNSVVVEVEILVELGKILFLDRFDKLDIAFNACKKELESNTHINV